MENNKSKPTCIGFIMDGNRRWAKAQGLSTLDGHKKGAEVFTDTVRWTRDNNIQHVVFYAFSSENWNRSKREVEYLIGLIGKKVREIKEKLLDTADHEKKVSFRFVGDISRFGDTLQKLMKEVEEESAEYSDTTVWIALSYGGRGEIIAALNEAVKKGEPMSEESFRALMWSRGMPDPDIIVRTGGEQRLSNFLTWQSVYSELLFLEKFWPDIRTDDLSGVVLGTYAGRKRNFGK